MKPVPDWLRPLYPFTPKTWRTPGGAVMSYLDEGGQGSEAVLMLHGNPTWSFYYRRLVAAMSPALRCIVPDHIGMGCSEKPENYAYTLAQRIADIEGLVAALGLTRVHLVVHDWGGAIGCGWAARYPEQTGRIVILNTAAFASRHLPRRIALCKAPWIAAPLVRGLNGFAGPATWMSMARRALSREEQHGYLWPYDSWANRVAVHQFVQDIPMTPRHPTWATLQAVEQGLAGLREKPAMIVWGGRDFCFNDHFYREWRERWPHAEAHYLADAGHYVLEDAAEDVVPRLAAFLTRRDDS